MTAAVPGPEADAPTVSVVIVNWNSCELLSQALTSLHETTTDVTFETVVVDNGSRDDSLAHLAEHWPGVTVVPLPSNHGFAAANNIGFRHCRGRYVLLLNADTIVLPTTLSGLVACMADHPEAGCVGARHLNPDGTLQWSMDDFPSVLNDTLWYTDIYRLTVLHPWLRRTYPMWSDHDEEREVDWVNGACLMVRSEVLDQVGGLDEYFFVYAEELDWCRRIWAAGWTVRFTPRAEIVHILSGTFSGDDGKRRIMLYQSVLRFYKKHYHPLTYGTITAMIRVNAACRLAALTVLGAARRTGLRPPESVHGLVSQEPAITDDRVLRRMWWSILRVGPDDPVRP